MKASSGITRCPIQQTLTNFNSGVVQLNFASTTEDEILVTIAAFFCGFCKCNTAELLTMLTGISFSKVVSGRRREPKAILLHGKKMMLIDFER